ncbi:MAG TPA: hypothetical protein VHO25_04510 [Polyangiaceae bacterium]|nr:hypothetical protein [Polyangiaceae bacterium]
MADHEQACSIATCEAFELSRQVTQLAEAVTELHPINSSDISQLRAELATARADAIGEAANEAKQRAATLQAVEIQSGNEKDLAYRDGGIAALENLAESLIQQGEGNDGPATHNEA